MIDYFIITVKPDHALKILNDDQCTGSRVSILAEKKHYGCNTTIFENTTDKAIYAIVDGERGFMWDGRTPVYSHIRDAIFAREGKNLMEHDRPKKFPRLRAICKKRGWEKIYVPGGEIPLHYGDELVVPDFSMSGTGWFIVPRAEISQLLAE